MLSELAASTEPSRHQTVSKPYCWTGLSSHNSNLLLSIDRLFGWLSAAFRLSLWSSLLLGLTVGVIVIVVGYAFFCRRFHHHYLDNGARRWRDEFYFYLHFHCTSNGSIDDDLWQNGGWLAAHQPATNASDCLGAWVGHNRVNASQLWRKLCLPPSLDAFLVNVGRPVDEAIGHPHWPAFALIYGPRSRFTASANNRLKIGYLCYWLHVLLTCSSLSIAIIVIILDFMQWFYGPLRQIATNLKS